MSFPLASYRNPRKMTRPCDPESVRRTRVDEDDGGTTTPQPTPLHSHLGPLPPRTPKHMALWALSLFGRTRGMALEGGAGALRAPSRPNTAATGVGVASKHCTSKRGAHSTARTTSSCAQRSTPRYGRDVAEATSAAFRRLPEPRGHHKKRGDRPRRSRLRIRSVRPPSWRASLGAGLGSSYRCHTGDTRAIPAALCPRSRRAPTNR
ncbi:hypothetical protein B0H14DRAFT_2849352 [Mycena olivaceomarginata]|nr:hypothetical protein B0H14DRAFT_2849352 [Mycena olivaceomarginata]